MPERLNRGIGAALVAALLFGASTPLAKLLVGDTSPWLLAGLLYLGSGVGLAAGLLFKRGATPAIAVKEKLALAGAIAAGGIVGPVLLMWALARMPASSAALLLNAEAVFTALIAWRVFRENVDRRIALGMGLIVAGAAVLSGLNVSFDRFLPAAAVLAACLAWAIDNNLTRKVSLADPRAIAMLKGLVAGATNTLLALATGAALPSLATAGGALVVGWLGYGVSLALFVYALRELGTARTAAYFSVAPFAGAVVAVLLGEPLTGTLVAAGLLMAAGVWLHVTERHSHRHSHEALEHAHEHSHDDEHHRHAHDVPVAAGTRHTHAHRHERLTHEHAHYPDAHHRHPHS